MSNENETKKNTRKVYKNKGVVHVCWKGSCYQPPAGSGALRNMTVEIVAEKGSPTAVVFLPTDEGDDSVQEVWTSVETHWRSAKVATEPEAVEDVVDAPEDTVPELDDLAEDENLEEDEEEQSESFTLTSFDEAENDEDEDVAV